MEQPLSLNSQMNIQNIGMVRYYKQSTIVRHYDTLMFVHELNKKLSLVGFNCGQKDNVTFTKLILENVELFDYVVYEEQNIILIAYLDTEGSKIAKNQVVKLKVYDMKGFKFVKIKD